jgi:hypothetical protein
MIFLEWMMYNVVLLVEKLGLAVGFFSTIATASGPQVQAWRGYLWRCF